MTKNELKELYTLMIPEYPDIITVPQLQTMLGISRHLAYDLINKGCIPGVIISRSYKIPKINVIKYLLSMNDQKEVS